MAKYKYTPIHRVPLTPVSTSISYQILSLVENEVRAQSDASDLSSIYHTYDNIVILLIRTLCIRNVEDKLQKDIKFQ